METGKELTAEELRDLNKTLVREQSKLSEKYDSLCRGKIDQFSWTDLIGLVIDKLFKNFTDEMEKRDLSNAKRQIDDLLNKRIAWASDDYLNIEHKEVPREYMVLYFLRVVDTIFDCVDECSGNCRAYLNGVVMDFFNKYMPDNK